MKQVLNEKEQEFRAALRKLRRVTYPSVRDIAKVLNIPPATVQYRIKCLREKGWLKHHDERADTV
jgi:Mn-dependent DtxR family transcriptional regulator